MKSQFSEIQVSYTPIVGERQQITGSLSAYDLLINNWNPDTINLYEEFKVIFMNQAGYVIGIHTLSRGGMTGTVVDPKLLWSIVLSVAATRIIIAHNHPSGSLRASQQDIKLTQKLKHGGSLLDIELTDHLIVTSEGYMSFMDDGLL